MYVDGEVVAYDSAQKASDYTGWWRIGAGTRPTGPTSPTANAFDGLIDNVAIYHSGLTPQRVAAHFDAR